MTWNSEKIKLLRCRLGWTQAELARKLNCRADLIHQWETSNSAGLQSIESHVDALVMLERQAEFASDQVFQTPLAESFLDETRSTQVDAEVVKRRFFENN